MLITKSQLRNILLEITRLDRNMTQRYRDAMMDSSFWLESNSIEDVDLVTDSLFSTPSIEVLMDALNEEANRQNSELYFLLAVTDYEEYSLNPGDKHGGYPNNWLMRGMYQGPMSNKHVIYLEFRPLGYDYRIEDLNP